jgi:hypothetical protein
VEDHGVTCLTGSLNEALYGVLNERCVTLLGDRPFPIPLDDPASVVSGLPCVAVDSARGTYGGRRRRLRLRRGAARATLLARVRPLPPEPERGWLVVARASAPRGRRVPVCAVDGERGRIHLLLDLETAEIVDGSPGLDPAGLLAEAFVGEPIAFLLRQAPPARVGRDVRRHVRALLERQPGRDRDELERELKLLRRLAPRGSLPRALALRVEKLTRSLRSRPDAVTEQRVERELSRLVKLVASRALAAIRLGPARIEGLINPGALGAEWRLRAVMFRLLLGETAYHPILQTWDPLRAAPRRGYGHCLGEAHGVLHDRCADGDLFGLIDTVLNFRETNLLRAAPVAEPTWLGARLCDWVAPLL